MRRLLPPILIGLGAFLIIAAVMMRFYAYPQVAKAPADIDTETRLEASDATVFDTASLSEQTVDLEVVSTTRGDVEASEEEGGGVLVWAGTTTTRSDDGVIRSQSVERVPFDEVTGEAVNCCDSFDEDTEGERVPVKREGLVFKFPFDTQKETYDFWDGTLGEAVPAEFVEETDIDGLTVYVFRTEVEPTDVGTREVPGSVVGEDDETVDATVRYGITRTFWVEPATGALIDRRDQQVSTLAIDGEDRVTTTEADIRFTEEQVQQNVDDRKTQALLLSGLRGLFPLIALILGLALVAIGVLLMRRGDKSAPADRTDRAVGTGQTV